jgi:Short C-terminal domain
MRDVRVDTKGELRCWHCGSTSFREKRTLRSKLLVGVGALVTKKKMKCRVCGEYNDTGRAKPYKGPASRRLGKKYGTLVDMFGAETPDEPDDDVPDPTSDAGVADELKKLAELRDAGVLSAEEFEAQKARLLE